LYDGFVIFGSERLACLQSNRVFNATLQANPLNLAYYGKAAK